jgi:signal transduction histidine kinase
MREALAVVSHDLRSPLENITASTQLLERLSKKEGDAEGIGRHLKSIRRAGHRMMRLIDDSSWIATACSRS